MPEELKQPKIALVIGGIFVALFILGAIADGIGAWEGIAELFRNVSSENSKPINITPNIQTEIVKVTRVVEKIVEVENVETTGRIFTDDFSRDSIGSDWQPVSGDWQIRNGVLEGVGTHFGDREWAVITLNKEVPKNIHINLTTKIVDGYFGELMIHLSNNRYIRIYLYEVEQVVEFGDGVFINDSSSKESDLGEVLSNIGGGRTIRQHSFPVKQGIWYSITLIANNNTYIVKVGGQKLIEYTDENNELSQEGTIGLIANGRIQFDNIQISTP